MGANEGYTKTVAICICTYQRPKKLSDALRSVSNLTIPKYLKALLIVIDNSPSLETKSVFDKETASISFDVAYVEEQNKGIVNARNRALEEVKKYSADYVAFFDDDDYVDENWLSELWLCMNKYNATVVSGRVRYSWPPDASLSEEVRRIYDNAMSNMKTGMARKRSSTCNTLFDFKYVEKHNLTFHPRLNLTGGEDSHFFGRMHQLGAKIVWCEEAKVYSEIDASRVSEEFVFKRRYNVGYTAFILDSLLYGKTKAIWKSIKYVIDIGIRTLFNTFRESEKVRVRTKRRMNEAHGRIDAMLGKKFENYASIDGE